MVRRICWIYARTMTDYKGDEESLWQIDNDRSTEPKDMNKKIEVWRERLIELGKWQKKN